MPGPTTLIVALQPGATPMDVGQGQVGGEGEDAGYIAEQNLLVLEFPDEGSRDAALALYESHPAVLYAQPEYIYEHCLTPNDPSYPSQWGFAATTCRFPQAWDIGVGQRNVRVGVMDTGVDASHPDLQASLVATQDFGGNGTTAAVFTHGTHVSGTIAATVNNARGVAGCAWRCQLYVAKCCWDTGQYAGSFGTAAMIAGVNWLVSQGCWVYNMSVGGPGGDNAFRAAIQSGLAKWSIPVAAAGNTGNNVLQYPGAWPECIEVANVQSDFTRNSSSTYNAAMWVAAPGTGILSTVAPNAQDNPTHASYLSFTGTSMASPHVAGLVALMLSMNATMTPQQVRDYLKESALDIGTPGWSEFTGWGLIQADAAMKKAAGWI